MTKRLLRTPPIVGALLAALTLAACGSDHKPVTHGESEAVNVQAGELIYQVQLSRELNPAAPDDRQYLQGVADPQLDADELWFAVWVRVQNTTDAPQQATDTFRLVDAEGNTYEPVEIDASNPFQYAAQTVASKERASQPVLPSPNSAAGSGPIQGSMLLFKVPYSLYENAPVELEIVPPEGGEPSTVLVDL